MNIILACDENFGIGIDNKLPSWNIREDMIRFKNITTSVHHNAIIMGKNTYYSLGEKALQNRYNFVVSNSLYQKYCDNNTSNKFCKYNKFVFCKDFETAINSAIAMTSVFEDGEVWIIGGAILYEHIVTNYKINKLHVTKIHNDYNCNIVLGKNTIQLIQNIIWTNIESNKLFTFFDYNKNLS